MKNFLLTIAIEGLEDKYRILLSRGIYIHITILLYMCICTVSCAYLCMYFIMYYSACTVLKNRKFIGALPEQTVRQKPKPFIIEVDK